MRVSKTPAKARENLLEWFEVGASMSLHPDAGPDGPKSPVFYRAQGCFDGIEPGLRIDHGLLVADGRILEVGLEADLARSATHRHDLGDCVIVPGFIDAHTHITVRPWEGDQHGQLLGPPAWQIVRGIENLRRMLKSGVTTARIMTEAHDIDFEFRDAIVRGDVCGPRLFVSGAGLSPPGGHGSMNEGVAGIDDLRVTVRERADRGADHIKIFTTGGVSSMSSSPGESNYSGEEISAIVDEAKAHGLRVSAHAHGGAGVELAVENGIHSIEHGAFLSLENVNQMKSHGTWLVLTNSILFHPEGIERGDAQTPQIMHKVHMARDAAERSYEMVRRAELPLALGTDSMHGFFGYEVQWLVEHGWTVQQALLSATSQGAKLIGAHDVGVLREGARADFTVLRRDPFEDIRAIYDVVEVYKNGQQVVAEGGFCRPNREPS